MRYIVIFIAVVLSSCSFLVNEILFFPNKKTYIPEEKLPDYLQLATIMTLDKKIIQGLYLKHAKSFTTSIMVIKR